MEHVPWFSFLDPVGLEEEPGVGVLLRATELRPPYGSCFIEQCFFLLPQSREKHLHPASPWSTDEAHKEPVDRVRLGWM